MSARILPGSARRSASLASFEPTSVREECTVPLAAELGAQLHGLQGAWRRRGSLPGRHQAVAADVTLVVQRNRPTLRRDRARGPRAPGAPRLRWP